MEFVGDDTLQGWMDDERLYKGGEDEQQLRLLGVAHQLACGVQHLHSLGILHQDIKPDNVLMSEEGKPVLADVGVSAQGTSESGRVEARLKGASLAFASPHVRRLLFEAKSLPAADRASFLEANKITHLDDIWCVAATIFNMFAETGWRKWQSVAEVWSAPEANSFELRVPTPTGLRGVLNDCFAAAANRTAGSEEEMLTMESVAGNIGNLLRSPAPRLRDGLNNTHCSIIHNNLGLGLHESGFVAEARAQYEHAIEADGDIDQTLEFKVRDAEGPFAIGDILESVGGIERVWKVVHEKLKQVLGAEDHPIGCTVDVEGDTITVHIIRAAMWAQMSKEKGIGVGVVTDIGFLHVLRDQILSGDFERDFTQLLVEPIEQCEVKDLKDLVKQSLKTIKVIAITTLFAEGYERSVLMLKSLTPHQAGKMRECCSEGELIPRDDTHIKAPAGGGKTFLGMHMADNLLKGDPGAIGTVRSHKQCAGILVRELDLY
jgi:hypothetical protein